MDEVLLIIKSNEKNYVAKVKETNSEVKIDEDFVYDDETFISISKYDIVISGEIEKMKAGDISPVIRNFGNGISAFEILVCTDRTSSGYKDFNDMQDVVLMDYNTYEFSKYIDELHSKASVKIIDKLYNKVTID